MAQKKGNHVSFRVGALIILAEKKAGHSSWHNLQYKSQNRSLEMFPPLRRCPPTPEMQAPERGEWIYGITPVRDTHGSLRNTSLYKDDKVLVLEKE